MGRTLRFIPPGSVVEVTTRTVQGRRLLRPSEELNEIILGILGRAQELFGLEIHVFTFLSNHFHMLLTVRDAGQLAGFMAHLNGNIARAVGRLHDWPERFWGRRYSAIVVADELSQVRRLKYCLAHGCKEGLVGHPEEWPGVSCAQALTSGARLSGSWPARSMTGASAVSRPHGQATGLASPRRAIHLTPLPCWRELDTGTRQELCRELLTEIESEALLARGGAKPLGVKAILALHPHGRGDDPPRGPAPLVHASDAYVRALFMEAYRSFVDAYPSAATSWKSERAKQDFIPYAFPPPPLFFRPANPGVQPIWSVFPSAAPGHF